MSDESIIEESGDAEGVEAHRWKTASAEGAVDEAGDDVEAHRWKTASAEEAVEGDDDVEAHRWKV